jgi:transposase-like protein
MTFPRNILDFQERFSNERACWDYLRRVRWPKGFRCPYDGSKAQYFLKSINHWECLEGHRISVTTDTVMHRSHIKLRKWFWAAYLVTTQKTGISAWNLAKQIGVHYETAYMMLQRLRAGMVCPQRDKISGTVEIDEAYVSAGRGRKVRKRKGRGTLKPLVVCAVQVKGKYAGQLRIRRITSFSSNLLQRFALDYIAKGSPIVTDGLPSYSGLRALGFKHVVRKGVDSVEVAKKLPHVHRAFSNLKTWLIGTHHGVSSKHLQAYLNEFAFRYNHRHNLFRAFNIVLGCGATQEGPEYEELYNAGHRGGWRHPATRQCT